MGRTALVTAASGIGDVLRITPLVRVLATLGHKVDLLLEPDYPDVVTLLEGAPEIRRIFHRPSRWSGASARSLDGVSDTEYDVATFTTLSTPLARLVRARRRLYFDRRRWLAEGDVACVRAIAAELGWRGPLPDAFAMASERSFDLPEGTVALHPGCKSGWPWKKWHGFEDLAARLQSVVVLGTPSDLDNGGTYFRRPFRWPEHARSFVGALNLRDTAALLRECAALVSNDSGLMHLAVAVGTPTFGVFGITSPARESLPSPLMLPVTKGLPCEPACRRQPWGRRDCDRHLECLKTLAADDVLATMRERLPRASSLLS